MYTLEPQDCQTLSIAAQISNFPPPMGALVRLCSHIKSIENLDDFIFIVQLCDSKILYNPDICNKVFDMLDNLYNSMVIQNNYLVIEIKSFNSILLQINYFIKLLEEHSSTIQTLNQIKDYDKRLKQWIEKIHAAITSIDSTPFNLASGMPNKEQALLLFKNVVQKRNWPKLNLTLENWLKLNQLAG